MFSTVLVGVQGEDLACVGDEGGREPSAALVGLEGGMAAAIERRNKFGKVVSPPITLPRCPRGTINPIRFYLVRTAPGCAARRWALARVHSILESTVQRRLQ